MSNNIEVFEEEIDIKTILVFIKRNKKILLRFFIIIISFNTFYLSDKKYIQGQF